MSAYYFCVPFVATVTAHDTSSVLTAHFEEVR